MVRRTERNSPVINRPRANERIHHETQEEKEEVLMNPSNERNHMNKVMLIVLITSLVTSTAFAGGSVSAKDRAFGDCQVNAPKKCGGYRANMTKEEYTSFQACTDKEGKECWVIYTKK